MSNTKLTMHSKVRFSQRVDYREFMEETVEKVLKYGVRLDDIPIDKIGLNYKEIKIPFIEKNKKGNLFEFDNVSYNIINENVNLVIKI